MGAVGHCSRHHIGVGAAVDYLGPRRPVVVLVVGLPRHQRVGRNRIRAPKHNHFLGHPPFPRQHHHLHAVGHRRDVERRRRLLVRNVERVLVGHAQEIARAVRVVVRADDSEREGAVGRIEIAECDIGRQSRRLLKRPRAIRVRRHGHRAGGHHHAIANQRPDVAGAGIHAVGVRHQSGHVQPSRIDGSLRVLASVHIEPAVYRAGEVLVVNQERHQRGRRHHIGRMDIIEGRAVDGPRCAAPVVPIAADIAQILRAQMGAVHRPGRPLRGGQRIAERRRTVAAPVGRVERPFTRRRVHVHAHAHRGVGGQIGRRANHHGVGIGIQAAGELHQGNLIAADAHRIPVAVPADKVCGGGPQHEQARVLPGPQTRHLVLPGEEVERPRQRAAVVGQHRIIAPGHVPHDGKAAIVERPALAVELQAVVLDGDVAVGCAGADQLPAVADSVHGIFAREAVQRPRHGGTRGRRIVGGLVRHTVAIGTDGRHPRRIDPRHRRVDVRHRSCKHLACLVVQQALGHRAERAVRPDHVAEGVHQIIGDTRGIDSLVVPEGEVQRHAPVRQRVVGHLSGHALGIHHPIVIDGRRRRLRIVALAHDGHRRLRRIRRVVRQRHGHVERASHRRREADDHVRGLTRRHRQRHRGRRHTEEAAARPRKPDAAHDQIRVAVVRHHHRQVRRRIALHRPVVQRCWLQADVRRLNHEIVHVRDGGHVPHPFRIIVRSRQTQDVVAPNHAALGNRRADRQRRTPAIAVGAGRNRARGNHRVAALQGVVVAGGKYAAARVLNVPSQTEPARRHVANRDARAAGGPRRRRCAIHQRTRNHRRLRIIVNHLEAHRGAAATLHRVSAQIGRGVNRVLGPLPGGVGHRAVRHGTGADQGAISPRLCLASDDAHHVNVRSALRQRHRVVTVEVQIAGKQVGFPLNRRVGAAVGHHIHLARRQRPAQRNRL